MQLDKVRNTPLIVPKESCPRCGRPVVLLKSGRCLYCGSMVSKDGMALDSAQTARAIAEATLEPRGEASRGKRWTIRVIAIAVSLVVIAVVFGTCTRA